MSLQSHMKTYFLHVHWVTGAGAGAGVADDRETTNGVPQWGHSNFFRHGGGGGGRSTWSTGIVAGTSEYKKEREF